MRVEQQDVEDGSTRSGALLGRTDTPGAQLPGLRRSDDAETAGIAATALALYAGTAGTNVAVASSPIGPNQHFVGLVNGKHANAVIYTVCPGPAIGADGPPAGGQHVAVRRVSRGGGDTGAGAGAQVIYARITATTIVALKAYRSPQPIPTSARVPCQGSGTITFSTCPLPQPCGAGAKVDNVPVTFMSLAV